MKSGSKKKKNHETLPNAAFLISFFSSRCFAARRKPSPHSRVIYCLGLGSPQTSTQNAITDPLTPAAYQHATQYQYVWALVA